MDAAIAMAVTTPLMEPTGNGLDLDGCRETAAVCHKMIEAAKLSFVDAKKFVADPRCMRAKVSDMLSGRQAVYPEAGGTIAAW